MFTKYLLKKCLQFSIIPQTVKKKKKCKIVCSCSVTKSCPTFRDPMDCSMPGSSLLHYLLEFTQILSIASVMLSSRLILCCPLLLLPSFFPSIRVFSSASALRIRWPKYWNFSFSIIPSNEYSGPVSFRIGWFDLFAVQKTLKSLHQHHNFMSAQKKTKNCTENLGKITWKRKKNVTFFFFFEYFCISKSFHPYQTRFKIPSHTIYVLI